MKMILQKVRVLSIVLFSIVLAVSVLGCPSGGGDTPSNHTPTTRQEQINATSAGSTVTLNTSFTDTTIRINKALTVDGNNIRNLNVIVDSSVRNNVTLRNFRNANITVDNSSRRALENRMARTAEANAGDDNAESFPKMTDGAVPLHLEGCTIGKIEAEADLALYLENGDLKSVIDEIKLKEGIEDFSFVEIDENGEERPDQDATPLSEKSAVGLLNIDDEGIKKINLIGGTFNDVDFADNLSDELELMYDKEFEDDQLNFEDKDGFFDKFSNSDDIEAGTADVGKVINGSGVYKFTIADSGMYPTFSALNEKMTIVLMNQNQIARIITNHSGISETTNDAEGNPTIDTCATLEEPMYMVIPTGLFAVDWQGNQSGNLKTIYGSAAAYVDYARANARGCNGYEAEDVVSLDYFRNYNKEAFIVEKDGDNVNLYVNMAAIKKADLVLCSTRIGGGGYGEAGTKITDIDLEGYVPYFAFDEQFPDFYYSANVQQRPNPEDEAYLNQDGSPNEDAYSEAITNWINARNTWLNADINPIRYDITDDEGTYTNYIADFIPYGDSIKLPVEYRFYFKQANDTNATYPDVTNVEYSEVSTEGYPNLFFPDPVE